MVNLVYLLSWSLLFFGQMLRKVEGLQCLLMVVQLHAVFAVFLPFMGNSPVIWLTHSSISSIHVKQREVGIVGDYTGACWHWQTLLCRLSMGKYMHKQTQPQNHNSSISMSLQFTESLFPSTLWGGGNGKLAKLCRSAWHVLWDLHGDGISSIAYITELVKTPSSGPEPPSVIGTSASWEGY